MNPSNGIGQSVFSHHRRTDDAGLSHISAVALLKKMRPDFENCVKNQNVCDCKVQEVLKHIRSNLALWNALSDKCEVRSIRANNSDNEIFLHPRDEEEARWSGQYHIYLTVKDENGRRLILDPYIGGDRSFMASEEDEYIKFHWLGNEGSDYLLEKISPLDEINTDHEYSPEFTLSDFINDMYWPDLIDRHKPYIDYTHSN